MTVPALSRRDAAYWASIRRRLKAAAFIRVIDASGLAPSPTDVLGWSEDTWAIVTDLANKTERHTDDDEFSEPSLETVALVANMLERREQLVASLKKSVQLGERGKSWNVIPFRPAGGAS